MSFTSSTGSDNGWDAMYSLPTLEQAANRFWSDSLTTTNATGTTAPRRASLPNASKAPIVTRSTGTGRGMCCAAHLQANQHQHQEETWHSQATPCGSKTC